MMLHVLKREGVSGTWAVAAAAAVGGIRKAIDRALGTAVVGMAAGMGRAIDRERGTAAARQLQGIL